jgi:hypothetical protein
MKRRTFTTSSFSPVWSRARGQSPRERSRTVAATASKRSEGPP